MAAIAPDFSRRALLRLLGVALANLPGFARAPRDVRGTITYVSSALANGNPSDALSVFSKGCPGYEKLVDYFSALTTGYEVASEIEITDETPGKGQAEVEATWSLTLTGRDATAIGRHSENVKIRLQATGEGKDANWKIIEFVPIELFNPQKATS